jgi:sulfide:quinone oxidoreductase
MTSPAPRVVVLGAGVAGLEAALLLARQLAGRVDVQVVSDSDEFVLRPNLVYLPFGADITASRLRVDETLARAEIQHERGKVEGVDTDIGRVHLVNGRQLPYEHLVIATGAASWRYAVPGLDEHAVSIWEPAGMLTLRERFLHVRGRAREGARQRVLFVVPRHNRYPLSLCEVRSCSTRGCVARACASTSSSASSPRSRPSPTRPDRVCTRSSSASSPSAAFDARTAERVVEARAHEATFAGGGVERFDLLVTAPPHRAGLRLDGLPVDDHGFVRVESPTRQVVDHPELYAPGDAGDFRSRTVFSPLADHRGICDPTMIVRSSGRPKYSTGSATSWPTTNSCLRHRDIPVASVIRMVLREMKYVGPSASMSHSSPFAMASLSASGTLGCSWNPNRAVTCAMLSSSNPRSSTVTRSR